MFSKKQMLKFLYFSAVILCLAAYSVIGQIAESGGGLANNTVDSGSGSGGSTNIQSQVPSITITNNGSTAFLVPVGTIITNNWGSTLRVIGTQTNFSSLIVTNSLDTGQRNLYDASGVAVVRWGSPVYDLVDASNTSSVAWNSRSLLDSSGNQSIGWGTRTLRNANNFILFNYNTGDFGEGWGGGANVMNLTNKTTYVDWSFNSNVVVGLKLAVGTNLTDVGQVVIQGISASTTNLIIRPHSAQVGPLIEGYTTGGVICFRIANNGTMNWGGSSAAASATANSVNLNGSATFRSATAGQTAMLSGGTGAGGDSILASGLMERARATSDGLVIGTNSHPGATAISWTGSTNFNWTPGSIAVSSSAVTNMSMLGALSSRPVIIGHSSVRAGLVWGAACTNDGVITVTINNNWTNAVDPGEHTIRLRQIVGQ